MANMDFNELPEDTPEEVKEKMKAEIAEGGLYGDRKQELVIIGVEMKNDEVATVLDACLLTDEEMSLGPDEWAKWENPFADVMAVPEDDEMTEGDEFCELDGEEDGEEEEDEEDGLSEEGDEMEE
jgi:hypothetical protein